MSHQNISKMSKIELLEECNKIGIIKCNSKNKTQLIELINLKTSEKTPTPKMMETTATKLNVIDLFCGCGGMSWGMTTAGLNIIAGIDIWDKAVENYNLNYEHKAYCHDLTVFPPEQFDELYNTDKKSVDILAGLL